MTYLNYAMYEKYVEICIHHSNINNIKYISDIYRFIEYIQT